MDVTIPHHVTYEFDGRATVKEVADALVAQDRLVREALSVLEEVFPDLTFEAAKIAVRGVSQDSPLRTYLEAMVVAVYAPGLGEDVPDILNTLFGVDVPDGYDSVVSVLVLLIAVWGIDWVRAKMFPGKKEPELLSERERLLVAAATQASVTRDQMEEAIESTLSKHKRSVMKAATDFLSPAKRHKADSVTVPGAEIRRAAIEAIPSDIDLAQYEPPSEMDVHEGVMVEFRAHDLDKNKAWAATIAAVANGRKPLHLAPDLEAETLFQRRRVKADVLVTSLRDQDGDYIPALYYLQRVYDDDA